MTIFTFSFQVENYRQEPGSGKMLRAARLQTEKNYFSHCQKTKRRLRDGIITLYHYSSQGILTVNRRQLLLRRKNA